MAEESLDDEKNRTTLKNSNFGFANISELHSASQSDIVENLKQRYLQGLEFTEAGAGLLLKIKPSKNKSTSRVTAFRKTSEIPAELKKLSTWMHWRAVDWRKDQALVLIGERGSGKTETMLQFLHCMFHLFPKSADSLQLLLHAQTVLQSFGTAELPGSKRASRIGQWIQLSLDIEGNVSGSYITPLLLEKSPICSLKDVCNGINRNFSIFYMLLQGSDVGLLKTLKLQRNPDNHACLRPYFTNQAEDTTSGVACQSTFANLCAAFHALGFTGSEVHDIFLIVAMVLKLSDLIFQPALSVDNTPTCKLENEYELFELAALIGCDSRMFQLALCQKTLDLKSGSVTVDLSSEEAAVFRQDLCKALYSRLFSWIVSRINPKLKSADAETMQRCQHIRLFDLYGFSDLEPVDVFEKFLVNYANECLYSHYFRRKLKEEQEMLVREGIQWQPLVELCSESSSVLEDLDSCLFLLDQQYLSPCSSQHNKSSALLLSANFFGRSSFRNCTTTVQKHVNCVDASLSSTSAEQQEYVVHHYAATVKYKVADFVQSNVEPNLRDFLAVVDNCRLELLKQLFPVSTERAVKKPLSLCAQLQVPLGSVLGTLDKSECFFVCCILPSRTGSTEVFDENLVAKQVQYFRLEELCKLSKSGFVFQQTFSELRSRYLLLLARNWKHQQPQTPMQARFCVLELLRSLKNISASQFFCGNSRVFFRSMDLISLLEQRRNRALHSLAAIVQRAYRRWHFSNVQQRKASAQTLIASRWRGYSERQRFIAARRAATVIQATFRSWSARNHCRISLAKAAVSVVVRFLSQSLVRSYLLRLSLCLPSESPIDKRWPDVAPLRCTTADQELRLLHHTWRCHKYRANTDQATYFRMREKLAASVIFNNKKCLYALSVAHGFHGDYLRIRQNHKWRKYAAESKDDYVVFADIVTKVNLLTGKVSTSVMVISTLAIVILDQRSLALKYRCPASEVSKISLSPYSDSVAVLHLDTLSLSKEKSDFVFESRHVIEVVAKLFLVIQNSTGRPPIVDISSNLWLQANGAELEMSFRNCDEESLSLSAGCFSSSPAVSLKCGGVSSANSHVKHSSAATNNSNNSAAAVQKNCTANHNSVTVVAGAAAAQDTSSSSRSSTPLHRAKFSRKGMKLEVIV